MPRLGELRAFVDALLLEQPPGDPNGPFAHYDPALEVARFGLALAPWPGLAAWARAERLDALLLHRPWGAADLGLPVLAYHGAFDARLTTRYNPRLAAALGLRGLEVLGFKEGRPLGMVGDVSALPVAAFCARLEALFGGLAGVYGPLGGGVSRACVVGAMWPELLHEAAARGAQVYVTGQYRRGAAQALIETGLTVAEVGHARSERWGLRELAGALREAFRGLNVTVAAP